MARPMSAETKREKTLESLKNALKLNKMKERFLEDKAEEYMSFYDDLSYINDALIQLKQTDNCTLKIYTDAVSEKRRISSEMRSILNFLGLKPTDVNLPSDGGDSDEEL
ncbi:MAG: hypothetical protein E6357_28970 [Clostridiales bacterium]|nr:hypothetical protein [Clostridiales bacterium]